MLCLYDCYLLLITLCSSVLDMMPRFKPRNTLDNPYFASMIHNFWLSWFAFGGPLTFQLISMSPRLNLHVMESIQREMIFEKQLHNIQGG